MWLFVESLRHRFKVAARSDHMLTEEEGHEASEVTRKMLTTSKSVPKNEKRVLEPLRVDFRKLVTEVSAQFFNPKNPTFVGRRSI